MCSQHLSLVRLILAYRCRTRRLVEKFARNCYGSHEVTGKNISRLASNSLALGCDPWRVTPVDNCTDKESSASKMTDYQTVDSLP